MKSMFKVIIGACPSSRNLHADLLQKFGNIKSKNIREGKV